MVLRLVEGRTHLYLQRPPVIERPAIYAELIFDSLATAATAGRSRSAAAAAAAVCEPNSDSSQAAESVVDTCTMKALSLFDCSCMRKKL
jgi:hypothetical protein